MKDNNFEKRFDKLWEKEDEFRGITFTTSQMPKQENLKQFFKQELQKAKQQWKEELENDFFSCYPPDMENFSTMTESQAYRLVKEFWNKRIKNS